MASLSGSGILNQVKPDEFPILCDTCLGDNPLVRMQRITAAYAAACKICERPYNNYRWKAGVKGRYKKTEICITCAKLKNVCQTCILDLQYHLPVQVRDSVLQADQKINLPNSTVQRNWMIESFERNQQTIEYNGGDSNQSLYQPIESNKLLQKLQRNNTDYSRNNVKPCSYYARGECNRGAACSFSHTIKEHDPTLAKQNIKDRYHGTNDVVANKILHQQPAHNNITHTTIAPPTDTSITTLFIGSIDNSISEQSLHDTFNLYGDIQNISMVYDKNIAFVQFHTRIAAEEAINKLHNNLTINGKKLQLNWTKSKSGQHATSHTHTESHTLDRTEPVAKKQKTSLPLPPGINV